MPICAVDAWLTNRVRQVGASESYVTTVMPFLIAAFSVGHSAVGSDAETISALAPLATAAWMAGIWEAGVAAVPLVSVPSSPSCCSAARAPPDFTLSEVVKYGLPRFFGMTNTFSPVFSVPVAAPEDELDGAGVDVPDDPQAAMTTDTVASAAGSSRTRLREPFIVNPFNWGETEN